jgi:isoquinoline 1-oxidoreductase beta subunit
MSGPIERSERILSRREFIRSTAAAGGGLLLAFGWPAGRSEAERSMPATRTPSAFLAIGTDDAITIISPAVEMGQGGHTAMPMILIEELGGDWSRVTVQDAPADTVYNNPVFHQQSTVGSFSVRGWYAELRRIGAAAREMLLQAAAAEWGVPAGELVAAGSVITHRPTGRSRSFGSVASRAARLPVPQQPTLKSSSDFQVIGKSPRRLDLPEKIDGSARYGIDVTLPNMLYAAVKTCPTLGGTLKSFDDSAAKQAPGYQATVPLPDGIIVIADSYWRARQALARVKAEYAPGRLAGLDSPRISQILRAALAEPGTVVRNEGDAPAALAGAPETLEAVYEVPYLAHACMEPMNCTARIDAAGCEVWCGTQAPQGAQQAAANVLKIPADQVRVHTTYLGGGFGRRGESDFVTQAVIAAKAVGRPVKLIWSREEDIQHDYYRPAAVIRFRAAFDGEQRLSALEGTVVTSSAPTRIGAGPAFYTGSIADSNYSYAVPNFRVTGLDKDVGVRFGFWRSVNESHNPFMLEGFIDEIAHHLHRDPYEFRRALLQHERGKRQLAVLDLAAEKAGWHDRGAGHALGIAAFEAFGSYIATVADVSMKAQEIRLHRIVTAIDCGVAIHPDNIQAQLEGGMVYGLTAALRGEITLANGAVKQTNFTDYPMLTMEEMPRVECYVLNSTAAPGGVGEPGTAPIAPALANAIYAATGNRLRSLPLLKHGLTYSAQRA